MANIDIIVVGSGPSLADVTAVVKAATESDQTSTGWLHPADDRAALRVIPDPGVSGGSVVQVYYAGEPVTARQKLARGVYDELAAHTDWNLELWSDDAEDMLASRKMTRASN